MSSYRKNKTHRTILVTAGPTRAYLDDVRYISNYSSGALGFELCQTLKEKGYRVVAVVGPTAFQFQSLGLTEVRQVETPSEMESSVLALSKKYQPYAAIFSAAVLDFVPARRRLGKVSSTSKKWTVDFVPTRKIIDTVGQKYPMMLRVGFKLEAKSRTAKQRDKFALHYLRKKGLIAVCYNSLVAVGQKRHEAFLYSAMGHKTKLASKRQIALAIANQLINWDVSPSR